MIMAQQDSQRLVHSQRYGDLLELPSSFADTCEPTFGVEVEITQLDLSTGSPAPVFDQIYDLLPAHVRRQTQPELMQWQVEYATTPHRRVAPLRAELEEFERELISATSRLDARPHWTAVLPDWEFDAAMIRDSERSRWNIQRFGDAIPILSACSMHIHVAVPRHAAIAVADQLQSYVPLLVALSSNSPRLPGITRIACSQRVAMWAHDLPTSGFPRLFNDWGNFNRHVALLHDYNLITSQKDLYYFVCPTRYGTVEIRCCDLPSCMDHVISLASLVQALVVRLQQDHDMAVPTDVLHADLANAITHGPNAILTSCNGRRASVAECLEDLEEELMPIATTLKSEGELLACERLITENGSLAQQPRMAS
ncbi:MAG: glutamate-cysteine ligase family protein [Pirellulales bacterium]|nr:glutamate-cysteine ligase family protein [Pirellulales bacterium]